MSCRAGSDHRDFRRAISVDGRLRFAPTSRKEKGYAAEPQRTQ